MGLPLHKPGADRGCTVTSSNCVIWDGPAIPCISLCQGESITQAIYNLAKMLCDSAAGVVDITTLDLKCLVAPQAQKPEQLQALVQLIINKLCELDEAFQEEAEDPDEDPLTNDGLVRLPMCLQYETEDRELVVSLPINEYAKLLAGTICTLIENGKSAVTAHKQLVARVAKLEKTLKDLGLDDTVIKVHLSCLLQEPGEKTLQDAVSIMEALLCELKKSVGTHDEVIQAIGRQCEELGDAFQLVVRTQKMNELEGWVEKPVNLADALNNIWLTLCDLRSAFVHVANIVRAGCNDVLLDFEFLPNVQGSAGNLRLYGKTILPINFTSAPSSELRITDGVSTISVPVDIFLLTRTSTQVQLVGLGGVDPHTNLELDRTALLTFTLIGDLLDDENVACSKEVSKQLRAICDPRPVSAETIVMEPTYTGGVLKWNKPQAANPVRYEVKIFEVIESEVIGDGGVVQNVETPIYSATITSRVITLLDELTQTTNYRVEIVAVYDCANSEMSSGTFTTLTCRQVTVQASVLNSTTETDHGLTSPYLKINNYQASIDADEPRQINSGCDQKLHLEYALTDSQFVHQEQGQLFVDDEPVGPRLSMISGPGFLRHELDLDNLDPEINHIIEFRVSTEQIPMGIITANSQLNNTTTETDADGIIPSKASLTVNGELVETNGPVLSQVLAAGQSLEIVASITMGQVRQPQNERGSLIVDGTGIEIVVSTGTKSTIFHRVPPQAEDRTIEVLFNVTTID